MRPPAAGRLRSSPKGFRVHVGIVIGAYLSICAVGVFGPGPLRKDMMTSEWARAHVALCLAVTKGYNVSYAASPRAVLLQFLMWGAPFGAVVVNYAYIHAVSLYYFSIFMAYASAVALDYVTGGVGRVRARRIVGNGAVAVFLALSIGRTLFTMSGRSLPALVRGRLPASLTTGLGAGDRVGDDSVIPRDQR